MKERIIKKGTKITIKPFEKIKDTLNDSGYHKKDSLFFNDLMRRVCGKSFFLKKDTHIEWGNIISININYVSNELFHWGWHLDWIEVQDLNKKINQLLKY